MPRSVLKEKHVDRIGWFASVMAIVMFSSYVDQIRINMNGTPGSILLPVTTTINCLSWVLYALLKHKKDWPIFCCNALGILVGIATTFTALAY